MDLTSDSSPIFEDGNPRPGIYKIQNIYSETYLDIEVHSREVCCRHIKLLGEGRGIWEIRKFGAGYTVQRFDPGQPEQFCTPLDGIEDGATLHVGAYPVAWRVEVVNDEEHCGFGYIRFYWGTKGIAWDLAGGRKDGGAKVVTYHETSNPWQIWKLVPVRVCGAVGPPPPSTGGLEPGSPSSYKGNAGQPSTRAEQAESKHDGFVHH